MGPLVVIQRPRTSIDNDVRFGAECREVIALRDALHLVNRCLFDSIRR